MELQEALTQISVIRQTLARSQVFRGYGARLALVLRLLWSVASEDFTGGSMFVGADDVERASSLIDYFKTHVRKVRYGLGIDRRIEGAERILEWIKKHKRREFKRWEVHKGVKSAGMFPTPESLTAPLDLLAQHGYLRELVAIRQFGQGRPPSTAYTVNPDWDMASDIPDAK